MKKFILFFSLILISFGGFAQKKGKKKAAAEKPITTLAQLMESEKVLDYTLNSAGVLYISFRDNGKNRNGLAMYFCSMCKNLDRTVNMVRIMKYNSFRDPNAFNAYGVLLGEYSCY